MCGLWRVRRDGQACRGTLDSDLDDPVTSGNRSNHPLAGEPTTDGRLAVVRRT